MYMRAGKMSARAKENLMKLLKLLVLLYAAFEGELLPKQLGCNN